MKISKIHRNVNATGTSLAGYVKADYATLVKAFGEPTYTDPSGDGKVNTEWCLAFDVEDEFYINEDPIVVTIYDWKEPNAEIARTMPDYPWHIGGNDRYAVDIVKSVLEEYTNDGV